MSEPTAAAPVPADAPPVCPRHTDRVAYVRCQRCGRPVCPECQRPAAVGVHCVDCVREASRTAPRARSAFGAPLRGGRPVITLGLIGLSVASFLVQLAVGWDWTTRWAFLPLLGEIEPWRFLTAAFLHDPSMFLHIAFNMYALYVIGQYLEPALGRWRFASLYLLSAVGGSVAVVLLASPTSNAWLTWVLGASGAVFGLFGAVLVVLRRLGRDSRSILVVLGINAVIGFVVPSVSWESHLGGLVVGLALGAAFAYAPKARRREVAIASVVGMTLLLVVLAMVRYASV